MGMEVIKETWFRNAAELDAAIRSSILHLRLLGIDPKTVDVIVTETRRELCIPTVRLIEEQTGYNSPTYAISVWK